MLQQRVAVLRAQLAAAQLPDWLVCHTHGPFASHLSGQTHAMPVAGVLQCLCCALSALRSLGLPADCLADGAILTACCQPGSEPDWQALAGAVRAKAPPAAQAGHQQAAMPRAPMPPAPAPLRRADGVCGQCNDRQAAKACAFGMCGVCCPRGGCSRHADTAQQPHLQQQLQQMQQMQQLQQQYLQQRQQEAAEQQLRAWAAKLSAPMRRGALVTALAAEGLPAELAEQDGYALAYCSSSSGVYSPAMFIAQLAAKAGICTRRALVRQALARALLPIDLTSTACSGVFEDLIAGQMDVSMADIEARVEHLAVARDTLVAAGVAWRAHLGCPELECDLRGRTLAQTRAAAERVAASMCVRCQSVQMVGGSSDTCRTCAAALAPKDAVAAAVLARQV